MPENDTIQGVDTTIEVEGVVYHSVKQDKPADNEELAPYGWKSVSIEQDGVTYYAWVAKTCEEEGDDDKDEDGGSDGDGDVCDEKKYVTAHPFAYNIIEDNGNISLMTQREASYREPAEEVYNNKKLDDGKLFWESFRDNIEPPTPQIKELDGYKSEEEVSQDGEDDGGQG